MVQQQSRSGQFPAGLSDADRALLDSVERYLAAGLQQKAWWEQAYPANRFAQRFDLGLTYNRPDTAFGFFDQGRIDGRDMPLMGNFQSMFYDRPKTPSEQTAEAAQWMQEQIREFVLRYFMRVSDFREPQIITQGRRPGAPFLRPFSICPPAAPERIGFGFSQLFYKRRDSREIGQFAESEQYAIVDLRDLGPVYDWIVVKVDIFDFSFAYYPFGAQYPQIVAPLSEASYLVLTRDFITDAERPEPGVLGRYGIGYAFIKNPVRGLIAYGPGEFDAAIELINFNVLEDGRTRVDMVFVTNRPEAILNLSLDPIDWGMTLANTLSGGLAASVLRPIAPLFDQLPFRHVSIDPVYTLIDVVNGLTADQAAAQLCLSREELDRQFLEKHFQQHYQTVAGALQTWRQIPDWLAGDAHLPRWAVTGESA